MDIEKLLERAKEIGHDAPPFSVEERESAVELIFNAYRKPLEIEFVKSRLHQAGISVPNLNNVLHLMKRAGKIKHVSRGVYQTTSAESIHVPSRVQKKLLDSIGSMFSLNAQRENDVEKLQEKVDQLRREKLDFKQASEEV